MFKKVFSTSTVLLLAASTSFQSAAAVDQQVEVEAGATSPPPAPKLDDVAEELGGLAQELEDLAKDEASTEAFKSPPSAPSTNSQPSAPSNDESSSQSKSSKSMSKSGKNKASDEMDVFNQLNLARLAALQYVSLYAGDKDFVCDLLDETGLEDVVSFVDCSLTSGKARKLSHESGDGFGANVDDITFELFVGWQDQGYSADDVKEKLDGVLREQIPNYNTEGGYDNNDDDDSFSGKTWKPDGRKLRR